MVLLVSILALPILLIWSGYVLTKLWVWFVVATFPGAPILSLPAAIGVAIIVGYLTHQVPTAKDERSDGEKIAYVIIGGAMKPAIALLLGLIVSGFM